MFGARLCRGEIRTNNHTDQSENKENPENRLQEPINKILLRCSLDRDDRKSRHGEHRLRNDQ
jgi:hypothetical protein